MDFGIFTMFSTREGRTQSQVFQEWFDLVQVVEDTAIDTFWLGESHFRPNRAVLASPLIGASAVAARTKRIRVGLAVQVLPLANPLRVAEEVAIVDTSVRVACSSALGGAHLSSPIKGTTWITKRAARSSLSR